MTSATIISAQLTKQIMAILRYTVTVSVFLYAIVAVQIIGIKLQNRQLLYQAAATRTTAWRST
jgi:hypothetical protein